jgi:hypothetical protein
VIRRADVLGWLAAALLAPAAARAATPCALDVSVEPAWLALGDGTRAVVSVAGATGAPLVAASPGRLEGLRREGDRWLADYVPPEEPWPQVALVIALDGDAFGAVALPLHGRGTAAVRTRPATDVEVRIGDRTFGPARTDADGRADVPVVVPPGVRHATRGAQVIPLDPPPLHPVHVVLGRERALADRDEEVRVVVAAAGEEGGAWSEPPVLSASEGALAPAGACGPGAFAWVWRLGAGAPRVARLQVRQAPRAPPVEARLELAAPDASVASAEPPIAPLAAEVPGPEVALASEPPAAGIAPPARLSLGAWAGLALRPGSDAGWAAGGAAALWPERLAGRLGVAVEASLSSFSRSAEVAEAGGVRLTGRARIATLGLSAVGSAWRGRWLASASAGAGAALAATWVEQEGAVAVEGTGVAPELHAELAAGWRARRGLPFAVVRATWQGEVGSAPVRGAVTTFTVGAGWRLDAR